MVPAVWFDMNDFRTNAPWRDLWISTRPLCVGGDVAEVVEQVGTPQEVYETPKRRFVAGFVGSPMNFFRGRLTGEGDRATIEIGSGRFALPKSLVSEFSGTVREIHLGARPQHVALTEGGPEGALP
jgi:ABC-type sugar transport system ATPase subunit